MNFTSATYVAGKRLSCAAATAAAKSFAHPEVVCDSGETPQLVVWHETTPCTEYTPGAWKEGGYYSWACIMC
ncbi:MAG: hypothetical protein ABJC13_20595 [Acidobacteriota bacterium]